MARYGRRPRYPNFQRYPDTPAPSPAPTGPYEPQPLQEIHTSDVAYDPTIITDSFQSWGDFLEHVRTAPNISRHNEADDRKRPVSFSGTSTLAEAIQLASTGWHEGAIKIQNVLTPLLDKLTSLVEKQQFYMDVYSPMGIYDMGAVAMGIPDNALNFETKYEDEHGVRIVRIVVNLSASYGVNSDALITRGICIAGIVNALELSGIRTEVVLCEAVRCYDTEFKHTQVFITVKRPTEELDVTLLAYQVAHPSVLRRLVFRWQETRNYPDSSFGVPREIENGLRGDLYFGCTHMSQTDWTRYATPDGALHFIREQLKLQNVTLAE